MNRLPTAVLLLSAILSSAGALLAQQPPQTTAPFRLKDGDIAVFYGDSITEQRLYTADIENFVLTRFPGLHVRPVNSRVG